MGVRYISHSYISKSVKEKGSQKSEANRQPTVGFSMVIENTAMTGEQMEKLMDALDNAVETAACIMGW